jgi:hypothetical protein
MAATKEKTSEQRLARWLDSVASGQNTMSQRKLATVKNQLGGVAAMRKSAKQRGVHLLVLEDDRGEKLVAASTKPFKVIC